MNIARSRRIILRGLKLRCPACGIGGLYPSVFRMAHDCTACGLVFEREQGYFVGAIYINVIATQVTLIAVMLIYIMIVHEYGERLFMMLAVMGALLPILFFRHSKSLWLAVDHIIDPQKPAGAAEFDELDERR